MLKKFKRGRAWYVRGTVRGVHVYETTGTADKAKAEEYRARREAEVYDRSIGGERGHHTFGEAVLIYLQARQPGASYRYSTIRPLVDHFEKWPIERITQSAIDDYIKDHHQKAAPATIIRSVVTPMTAVLRTAAKRGWCAVPSFERPKVTTPKTRWLTEEEATRLIEASAPHLKPLIIFFLNTGARLSEALRLDWSDVDLKARKAAFHETKNGTSRGVPLNDDAWMALANLPHRKGRVFLTQKGRPYRDSNGMGGSPIRTALKAAARRAEIDNFKGAHALRHTFASRLVMAGVNLRTVAELMGHKSITMTMRYAHLSPDHLKSAVDVISNGAKSVQPTSKNPQVIGDKR